MQRDKVTKTTVNNERRAMSSFYSWRQKEEILLKTRKIVLPPEEQPEPYPACLRRGSLYRYTAGLAERILAAEAGGPL